METLTVSSKFQIVIPKKLRENMNIKSGQKLVPMQKGNSIVLVKIGPLKGAFGFAKGMSTAGVRDHSERFD
ncbi:MAG TPA: AbrB/MazE/SpoVT family DNA-binding domain-containing protein [Candidatus Diapherotrites archaeon]|uniref:AbrB/MazE/SpoVT family DNA-binding domain-containing protein n=1 Tax=Candidatus Iainarchaeum sp. TaxID=3101447 RepID=A0A7J4IZ23_9ARCH|nr:AbrB/MazE/SpoVT family DNA-binding domain-containing protein [Candidatus Diapherotrites archaeon]